MVTITDAIAKEITTVKFDDLPPAATTHLKKAVMDTVGIAFMPYQSVDRYLAKLAETIGGTPESTMIGSGIKTSCGLAAGINAQMSNDSDFDETGPGVHALSSIAHTGIAVGERVGASGKDVLTAIAIAYEFNGRFSRNLRDEHSTIHIFPEHARRHLIVNNTICAAKLLELSQEETNRALGVAWLFSPANPELFLKRLQWYGGEMNLWMCQLGVQAALMVKYGSGGPADILDKDGDSVYHLDRLTRSPKPFHYVINELFLKKRICSFGTMGGLELVSNISRAEGLQPGDVEAIIFRGSSLYTRDFWPFTSVPKDYWNAIGSIPWAVAMTFMGYDAGPEWVTEERLNDAVCLDLAHKVKVEQADSPFINEIEIRTGTRTFKQRIGREDFPGTPHHPMTGGQIEAKFVRCVSPVVGDQYTSKMIDLFNNFDQLDDIRKLTGYYSPPSK